MWRKEKDADGRRKQDDRESKERKSSPFAYSIREKSYVMMKKKKKKMLRLSIFFFEKLKQRREDGEGKNVYF